MTVFDARAVTDVDRSDDRISVIKIGTLMAKTTETKAPQGQTHDSATQDEDASPRRASRQRRRPRQAGPPRQPGVERRKNHPESRQAWLHRADLDAGHPAARPAWRPRQGPSRVCAQLSGSAGLATFATQNNLRMVEKHRQRLKELEEARRADLQNLAAQIAQRSLTIEANANAEGHLYGSVNADQIAEALRNEGFPIQAENVRIEGPLKELGLYSIKVHLAQDIHGEVKLWVVPTHTEEAPG